MREQSALETATSGSIRFNTDSSKLEIYNGEAWFEIDATSPELQTGGTRGIFAGGYTQGGGNQDEIEFLNEGQLLLSDQTLPLSTNPQLTDY